MTNDFKQSVRLLCLFSTHDIWYSGNSGWKRCSPIIHGNYSRSMFCFHGHHWEPCLTHNYFEKV